MAREFQLRLPRAPQSLGVLPQFQAGRNPDAPALTFDGRTLSRREFADRVHRRARALQAAGVGEGDFVAIALPNGHAGIEIAFGCWAVGATPSPISARLAPLELHALLEVLSPRLVVAGDLAVPARFEVRSGLDLDDPRLSTDPLPVRVSRHVKAIATGGSTGRPKVIVDHAPALLDPDVPSLGMMDGDTVVVPGPMHHSAPFGLVYQALAWGCHVVITPRFDAADTLRLVEQHRAAWLYQVPTMMHRIWRLGDDVRARHDVSSLEIVCHIAAPCPAWLKECWIEWLGPDRIWEVYSGTEAVGATKIGGREWLQHRGSVGKLMSGAELRVVDEHGNALPPGAIGEIYFRATNGLGSTYHYLGAEPRTQGEWESFGDLGWLDADGYLYLADRRTDLVICGGANVYPAEVEAAIDAHPAVLASVVVGLPDADLGQRLHAIVEIRDPSTAPRANELLDFLRERLASYKLPRSIEFTQDRLRDDSGKVRRSAHRDARSGA